MLGIGHPATTLVLATKGATFATRSPPVAAGYIHVPVKGLLRRPVGHDDLAVAPVDVPEMGLFAPEPAVFQVAA
jgi:hypothetical protein